MKNATYHLAFDLGASNARLIAAELEQGRLDLKELSRLEHCAFTDPNSDKLLWELPRITTWMDSSLQENITQNVKYQTLGIDTWGVDYALLNEEGEDCAPVVCYRDARTKGIYAEIDKIISAQDLYEATGSQFMEANTLCQLLAEQRDNPDLLQNCKHLLMLPNYLTYLLCGVMVNEPTQASTSQLFDIQSKQWNKKLIGKLGLPATIFAPLQAPGTILSQHLRDAFTQRDTNLRDCQVVQVATHDSASAVMAIPFEKSCEENCAKLFLSSGTWSVMGIELDQPILSSEAREKNFANELSFDGSIRFLRSLTGLWLLQEFRRTSLPEKSFSELEEMARQASPYRSLIPVSYGELLQPGNMREKLINLCQRGGEPLPDNDAELLRCIYDSLALEYRCCAEDAMALSGLKAQALHIVGGGAKSIFLNQLCADNLGLPVLIGPFEAAAIGNILAQLIATGACKSQTEARDLVRNSFPVETLQPDPSHKTLMDQAFNRYQILKNNFVESRSTS